MINRAKTYAAGTHLIYEASERGVIKMLSIVSMDSGDTTVYVKRRLSSGVDVNLIKPAVIAEDEAAYLNGRVILEGQSIVVITDKTVDIDLNIL